MNYRQTILDLLTEHGAMTLRELSAEINIDPDTLRGYVGSLRQRRPGVIYIHSYRRDEDGGRLYPRALYAIGNQPDAKPLKKLSRSEYNRRAKSKMKACVASVFHLGLVNRPAREKLAVNESFRKSA